MRPARAGHVSGIAIAESVIPARLRQPNAFLAGMNRGLAMVLREEEALTDLQQREVFIEERVVCGRFEEIKECGLRADVHGQFRARVHARLCVIVVIRGHT